MLIWKKKNMNRVQICECKVMNLKFKWKLKLDDTRNNFFYFSFSPGDTQMGRLCCTEGTKDDSPLLVIFSAAGLNRGAVLQAEGCGPRGYRPLAHIS